MSERERKQKDSILFSPIFQERAIDPGQPLKILQESVRVITSLVDRNTLLTRVIESAVLVTNAKSGGIYQYHPDRQELTLVADHGRPDHIKAKLKVGEGLAGRLVKSGESYRIMPDYNKWRGKARVFSGKREFGAVLEVLLKFQGKIVGVLYVDDDVTRKFTEKDAELLTRTAAKKAAIVLNLSDISERFPESHLSLSERLERWGKLSQMSNEIVGNLSSMDLQRRLDLIAKRAAEITNAQSCGICLIKPNGLLSWEAGYGYKDGVFRQGREFKIVSAPKAGLTGHIAKEGRLFNAWGEKLTGHGAVRNAKIDRRVYENCYSLLALPLKKDAKLIGLLRVENKLGSDGKPHRNLYFTQDDELILTSFCQAVAVALEEAKLVEGLERLVTSSPNGIIEIDKLGSIKTFNEEAERILGYKKEEVIGTPVSRLYFDPLEPRRIGRLLSSRNDGKLIKHPTSIKTKEGLEIPIHLSATWLYDSDRKLVGSVGYFEDQRDIQQKDRHLDLLLKASKIVAEARTLDEALQQLAKEVVLALTGTFCRILLLDENKRMLIPKAAYPILRQGKKLKWRPGLEKPSPVNDWPGLQKILDAGKPVVLSTKDKRYQKNLKKLTDRLRLEKKIESLLMVPLKIGDTLVGLLHVGELRREERAAFSREKMDLARAIADQTTALILRTRLFEDTEHDRQLLSALDEALTHIRAEKEPVKLLQEFVRLAAELIGCKAGAFYTNHPHLKQLELTVHYGIADNLKGCSLSHEEGLAGLVAASGERQVIYNYSRWPSREAMLEPYKFKTMIGIPLKDAGKVEAVLLIASTSNRRHYNEAELRVLERFASRSLVVLDNSELLSKERRMAERLKILHDITNFIQVEADLKDILHAVLTGITAEYGLGFNRAALLLLDEDGTCLVGREAIGQLTLREAHKAWDRDRELGLIDFTEYRKHYKRGNIHKTSLGKQVLKVRLPIQSNPRGPFSQVMKKGSHVLIKRKNLNRLPENFRKVFAPTTEVILIPLLDRDMPVGVLVADNKFTQSSITPVDIESLLTFTKTVETSLSNISLFQQTKAAREKLRSAFEASSELVSSRKASRLLKDIVAQTKVAADAWWVSLVLIDEGGQARSPITAGAKGQPDIGQVIRPNGISMQVMKTGMPVVIEDTLRDRERFNPIMFRRYKVAAALCLPLSLQGERIGVVWIHYAERHRFSQSEIDALQLYVNQAAIAYDSAKRVEDLKRMRMGAEALVSKTEPQDVINQIVLSACVALQADSVVFWYYDNIRGRFLPDISKAAGISKDEWENLKRIAPRPSGTAYQLFSQGFIQVKDLRKKDEGPHLEAHARRMLGRIKARRFLGIALTTGRDKLGVIYINYHRPRSFSEEEQEAARAFAHQAALALKRAKLLEQVNKARDTANLVAKLTTLENEDIDSTLQSVVEGTKSTLDCDAVTLYVYSPDKGRLSHEPVMTGVKYRNRTRQLQKIEANSIIYKSLRRTTLLVVSDTSTHPVLSESRFTKDEKIASCVVIPLIIGDEKVGIMFVNYRTHHRFTQEERKNIELLAHQAAVAIRNGQLYEQQQRRANQLQALYEAGKAVAGSLDEVEILKRIAEQVWNLASNKGLKRCFVDVKTVEGMTITLAVTRSDGPLLTRRPKLTPGIDLNKGIDNRMGIIGRAIKEKRTQIVGDVKNDPDYIKFLRIINSEIVVPIIKNDTVIGVINVEHPDFNAFDNEDARTLESLASQASIAIQNARAYANLQQTMGKLVARTALAWTGMASTSWAHDIVPSARTIVDTIPLLRAELSSQSSEEKVEDHLTTISESAKLILKNPITAPLSREEGVESVPLYRLIAEQMNELREKPLYKSVNFGLDPKSEKTASVIASSDWLKQAFAFIIHNAVKAMANNPKKILRVSTRLKNGRVEIRFTDNGKGIPPDVQPDLLSKAIKSSKGAGIGLLQVQAIVQTYGGDIEIGPTGAKGTTIIVWLPLEPMRADGVV